MLRLSPLCAVRKIKELQGDYISKALILISIDPFTKIVYVTIGDPKTVSHTFRLTIEAFKLVDEWMGVQRRARGNKLKHRLRFKLRVLKYSDENYKEKTVFLSLDDVG